MIYVLLKNVYCSCNNLFQRYSSSQGTSQMGVAGHSRTAAGSFRVEIPEFAFFESLEIKKCIRMLIKRFPLYYCNFCSLHCLFLMYHSQTIHTSQSYYNTRHSTCLENEARMIKSLDKSCDTHCKNIINYQNIRFNRFLCAHSQGWNTRSPPSSDPRDSRNSL